MQFNLIKNLADLNEPLQIFLIRLFLLINFFIDKNFSLSYKSIASIITLNLYTFLRKERKDHESRPR